MAVALRQKGYSLSEIAQKLNIAKSTSSSWMINVLLDVEAQQRLKDKKILGQNKAAKVRRNKSQIQNDQDNHDAIYFLSKIRFDSNINLLCCALLYWAEGSKTEARVGFTNSDPKMISSFLYLFRNSFDDIDEKKFRCLVHIHEYHNDEKIKRFWSDTTGIPLTQFLQSYLKPHTSKRKRDGYLGTISIRYYDCRIVRNLKAIYNTLNDHLGV